MLRGYYTPSPTPFQSKLEKMHLTSPTAGTSKLVLPATVPLPTYSPDKSNLSAASTSTSAPPIQTAQGKEGIRHSFEQELGKVLMTSPDLSTVNLNMTEDGVSPQQTINSIDMGFTLINEKNMQRSPSVEEVKVICDIYPGVSDVLHFPPYLRMVCYTLPEQI